MMMISNDGKPSVIQPPSATTSHEREVILKVSKSKYNKWNLLQVMVPPLKSNHFNPLTHMTDQDRISP